MNECDKCPGISAIRDRFVNKLDDGIIETITFKQRVSIDRCKSETMTDDFLLVTFVRIVTC